MKKIEYRKKKLERRYGLGALRASIILEVQQSQPRDKFEMNLYAFFQRVTVWNNRTDSTKILIEWQPGSILFIPCQIPAARVVSGRLDDILINGSGWIRFGLTRYHLYILPFRH